MLPHEKGSLHTVETCRQHGGSFCRVHGLRNQYKAEAARRTPQTSENHVPTEVANVVDFLATLSPDVFERERHSFLECFNKNSTRASERFLCNCCSCACQSSINLGYFQESRVKAYKTVANHEDDFGLGGPNTNFGVTSPLNLRVLKQAFDIVCDNSREWQTRSPHQTFMAGSSENQQNYSGTSLQQPSNLLQGCSAEEGAIHEFELEPSLIELEANLPWNDGACCRGQRGSMIGMNEDDLMDTTKREVFRIIMDILTRKVLHNRSAIDVTGELQNWKQSFVVRQDVRDLLPEDDNQLTTIVDNVIGIRRYTYDVCATKHCHHVFRCTSMDEEACPKCGQPRSTSLKMYHFSLIETLRALFKSPLLARYLQFNAKDHARRDTFEEEGACFDIFDTPCWREIMGADPYLSCDPRNIGLQLCTDGFQITDKRDSPSLWPISVNLLNLPPWLRYKPAMTFMVSLLPKEITSISPCLDPLIDELLYLYYIGIQVPDFTRPRCESFILRVGVVKVTADYRGLPKIYLLGQSPSVHGCFYCKNEGKRIKEFKKTIYPGAWRWLGIEDDVDKEARNICSSLNNRNNEVVDPSMPQPAARDHHNILANCLSVEEKRMQLHPLENSGELAKLRGPTGEIGLSPMLRLPYFRIDKQNYDAMHTVANCVRDLFACILGFHPSIHAESRDYEAKVNNRYKKNWKPTTKAPFVMENDKLVHFKNRLQRFRRESYCRSELQDGCSWQKLCSTTASLKTHDYHILCGGIGQWAIDGLYREPYERVVQTVFEALKNMLVKSFSSSSQCSKVKKDIVQAVALLEAIFPAFLLDHKWHQMLHLASDLPAWVNSMWSFERFNRFLLCRIQNKAHPEASLVEHYQSLQAVLLRTLKNSDDIDDASEMWKHLGLERGFDTLVFPSQWRQGIAEGALEGTAWLHGARRESECDDCDVIMGLHLFYLDALVTTEDGQFVGVGGGGVNR